MAQRRPLVGLLNNPAVPAIIRFAPSLVEYIDVIPDRLWYDFEFSGAGDRRFRRVVGAIEELKACAAGRTLGGHGIGLSLPSALPLDLDMVRAVGELARELHFQWFSEHLSMFLVAHGSVPNAQAGLGLPVAYDEETFALVAEKLEVVRREVCRDVLLENGAVFTPVPMSEMSEPEFLNRLYRDTGCGALLDLHNLYVQERNGTLRATDYLDELDPAAVREIHVAGGHELAGFYTDAHSGRTPQEVWDWAYSYGSRYRNLRAIVFEFHESYFDALGLGTIVAELERMHRLADALAEPQHAH
ncbi:MAG: DUF692 family protein [Hyphomicrobiales bacterium]|nr:DUF692 family protein [Hyphomicrobiales bacterium]